MKELITTEQANTIMLALIVVLPILGAAIGASNKQLMTGLKWGLGAGILNIVLWKVYNAITDNLGLDTVKNLLVNLGLFIVIGIVGGVLTAMFANRKQQIGNGGNDSGAQLAAVGGPVGVTPDAARTLNEADEPPRDAG